MSQQCSFFRAFVFTFVLQTPHQPSPAQARKQGNFRRWLLLLLSEPYLVTAAVASGVSGSEHNTQASQWLHVRGSGLFVCTGCHAACLAVTSGRQFGAALSNLLKVSFIGMLRAAQGSCFG